MKEASELDKVIQKIKENMILLQRAKKELTPKEPREKPARTTE